MATIKMTFSLPDELACQFIKRVPSRDRSRFLARALQKSLADEEKALIRSCELANADPDVAAIEAEWDRIDDGIEEPGVDSPPR